MCAEPPLETRHCRAEGVFCDVPRHPRRVSLNSSHGLASIEWTFCVQLLLICVLLLIFASWTLLIGLLGDQPLREPHVRLFRGRQHVCPLRWGHAGAHDVPRLLPYDDLHCRFVGTNKSSTPLLTLHHFLSSFIVAQVVFFGYAVRTLLGGLLRQNSSTSLPATR